MTTTEIIQVFAGLIGSMGFAVLFNVRGIKLLITSLGGLLTWLLFVILDKIITGEPVIYFMIALIVSLLAEIMARVVKTPASTFITTSLIPLIPGSSLYYTMVYAFEESTEAFLQRGAYTLQLAAAIALGIIVSTALMSAFKKRTRVKNI